MSLTSVICRLLERLIKDHIVDFLIRHKLLNPSQHGFLKNYCKVKIIMIVRGFVHEELCPYSVCSYI